MSSHATQPRPELAEAIPLAQVHALRRVALAVAHPGGPDLFADLVRELAASLQVGFVFMAVFADDSRTVMRTLAACLDGRMLRNFEYALEGSPCVTAASGRCATPAICSSPTPVRAAPPGVGSRPGSGSRLKLLSRNWDARGAARWEQAAPRR